jgi:hypothetical protein
MVICENYLRGVTSLCKDLVRQIQNLTAVTHKL